MRLRSLSGRLKKRSRRERQDPLAFSDPAHLNTLRACHKSPQNMVKKDVYHAWGALCRRLRRPIPVPESGLLPILHEKDSKVRDAGIRWFCGSFPGNPDLLQTQLGPTKYQQDKVRISHGLLSKEWTSRIRRETVASLLAFIAVLEGTEVRGTKRCRAPLPSSSRTRKHPRRISRT